jgi:hypothetical protein
MHFDIKPANIFLDWPHNTSYPCPILADHCHTYTQSLELNSHPDRLNCIIGTTTRFIVRSTLGHERVIPIKDAAFAPTQKFTYGDYFNNPVVQGCTTMYSHSVHELVMQCLVTNPDHRIGWKALRDRTEAGWEKAGMAWDNVEVEVEVDAVLNPHLASTYRPDDEFVVGEEFVRPKRDNGAGSEDGGEGLA